MQWLAKLDLALVRQKLHEQLGSGRFGEPGVDSLKGGVVLGHHLVVEGQGCLCGPELSNDPLFGAPKLYLGQIAGAGNRRQQLLKRILNLCKIRRAYLPPRARSRTC